MRKIMLTIFAISLLAMPALAVQLYTFDWNSGTGADYLGCFDNDCTVELGVGYNHAGSAGDGLKITKNTNMTDGVAQAFLAAIWNLEAGDEVTVSIWRYDMGSSMPYFRLWAHYNDALVNDAAAGRGQDMETNDGNMQGDNSFGLQTGWEQSSHTWTVAEGHTGIVIDGTVYGDYGANIYVDDIVIAAPDHADVRLPHEIYSGGVVTPVEIHTWTAVKAIFQ